MQAEFTRETFPRWAAGLHYFVYKMFEAAILDQGMTIDRALEAINKDADAESSESKKRSAEKIAGHLRKALTS